MTKSLMSNTHEDILATLSEFTARSISDAIKKNNHSNAQIIICGGGGNNTNLINRIRAHHDDLMDSEDLGFKSQAIESMAFAWLGFKRLNRQVSLIQVSRKKYSKGVLGSIARSKQ